MGEQLLNPNLTVPMVGMVENDENSCVYMKDKPNFVGDIAYIDENVDEYNDKIKIVSPDEWQDTLGTPIGVVVIPKGFAPDGETRIIHTFPLRTNGRPGGASTDSLMTYINTNIILPPSNYYTEVEIVDENGEISEYNTYGYLPSDDFEGKPSLDLSANYRIVADTMMLSPYINNCPNKKYYKGKVTSACTDFNGLSHTNNILPIVSLNIEAVNAVDRFRIYNQIHPDHVEDWYIPSIGELGYLVSRYSIIKNSIDLVGGYLEQDAPIWSSTEYSILYNWYLELDSGYVTCRSKMTKCAVYPFLRLK